MEVQEIIQEGNSILALDKPAFKGYYDQKVGMVKESKNDNYILEFELQQLQYLLHVETSYTKAIAYADNLLAKYINVVDNYLLSKLYRWIGVAHNHTGDLQKSMEAYNESIKLIEKIPIKTDEQLFELGLVYNNIAILFKNANENKKRLEYIRLSMAIFKKIDSEKGLGIVYNAFANYNTHAGKLDKAMQYQRLSLKIKKKLKDYKGIGVNYGNIAGIYLDKNDFVQAEKYLKLSEKLKTKHGTNYSLSHLYMMYGEFYLKLENPARAIPYLLKCHKITTTHQLKFELNDVCIILANTYEQLGDYKTSVQYLKEHIAVNKEINDIQRAKTTIELKERHETEKQCQETKILKAKNKEIKEHVIRLEKYSSELKQFAQIASHDLKEPLRAIKMHLMLLERSATCLNEKQHEIIDYTKKAAERLYMMVEDLKSFSNLDYMNVNKEIKPLQVDLIIQDLFKETKEAFASKKISLVVGNMPLLPGNGNLIKNLFSNLIYNAFYYNHNPEPTLVITHRLFKNHHIFKFKDNGVGIDSHYYSKIFELFERLEADHNYKGTGIGLAICKKIVDNMNGKIWVKSKIGTGSEFYISLPQH
jgi:signal transduction histidine kinase